LVDPVFQKSRNYFFFKFSPGEFSFAIIQSDPNIIGGGDNIQSIVDKRHRVVDYIKEKIQEKGCVAIPITIQHGCGLV
jgi:hypothetical protein